MATVLVVDDDAMILRLFKDIIELIGHEVVAMKSAKFALESLMAGLAVDLVVTDVIMPGMDGREFVEEILRHEDDMVFPILMISGEDMRKNLGHLLKNDRVDFIQKPLRVKDLIAALNDKISTDVIP